MTIWRRTRFDPPNRQCRHWLLQRLACVVVAFTALLHAAQSHAMNAGDAILTMVFIYNIAQFTEWPAAALAQQQQPLTLCMLGDTGSLTPGLSAIDAQTLQGRRLKVRHLNSPGLAGCQMLFIAKSEEKELSRILPGAHARHILTLSDIGGFAQAGGAVGLIGSKDTIAFDVNPAALKLAGLRISSEVLKLARAVAGK